MDWQLPFPVSWNAIFGKPELSYVSLVWLYWDHRRGHVESLWSVVSVKPISLAIPAKTLDMRVRQSWILQTSPATSWIPWYHVELKNYLAKSALLIHKSMRYNKRVVVLSHHVLGQFVMLQWDNQNKGRALERRIDGGNWKEPWRISHLTIPLCREKLHSRERKWHFLLQGHPDRQILSQSVF